MDELLKKFPELIKSLLEKLSQTEFSSKLEIKDAKSKLLSQLKTLTDEITALQNNGGEKLTEEQIKSFFENQQLPKNQQWVIKNPLDKK